MFDISRYEKMSAEERKQYFITNARLRCAEHAIPLREEYKDYVGEDGKVYCGICGESRQEEVPLIENIAGRACKCKREENEQRQKDADAEKLEKEISDLQKECFGENKELVNITLSGVKDKASLKDASAFVKSFEDEHKEAKANGKRQRGILISGKSGTGKTHIACAIGNELIYNGYRGKYIDIAVFNNAMMSRTSKTYKSVEDLEGYDFIIIDRLESMYSTTLIEENVLTVINKLHMMGTAIIAITTTPCVEIKNYAKNKESTKKGQIFGKLLEMCHVIEINGDKRITKINTEYIKEKQKYG